MSGTVSQPSALPTNKLTVAVLVGPAVTEAWGAIIAGPYPGLAGPAVSALVGAVAAAVVGYFVKDRPNVVPA